MQSRDFCYWLQGYFEIAGTAESEGLTPERVQMVRKHLDLVFKHEIDPSMGPAAHQQQLNKIHSTSAVNPNGGANLRPYVSNAPSRWR
jgi:hypothetical protein